MLIRERLENFDFSNSEQKIVAYILEKKAAIQEMTTKEIAEATYTSPSTLVRIAHKMNFSGWSDLKEAFLKEEEYLQKHFSEINANLPFQRNDTIMSIASKIAALEKESIDDTLSLITHDDLQKAIQIIRKSSYTSLFAVSNNLLITQEFQHNMSRIKKRVDICLLQGETIFKAHLADSSSCAIIVSYSGETGILNQTIKILKGNNIPVIAITNIGDNTTARLADCVLKICTREKLYSKIATFSTDSAIVYLLDVLYSCIFALDYDANLQLRISTSKMIESSGRFSTLAIIKEEDQGPR
ncbi:MurR/RpiR family transcriptional regulator [Trichococcus collinsii]|jgi:DNA-binding MurR/RpiR family transcriptional regulator|nr:MurR/RpiR family transcriptional regulator [Trichococcus collinsii]HEX5350036.1 MurR/RpiR family transcriptional regulator [Trichococcus sp.]